MNGTEKLLDLKKKIEKAKIDKSRSEGRLSELMKRLKTDFKCKDLKEAEKLQKKYEADIKSLNSDLETGIKKLKEIYDGW